MGKRSRLRNDVEGSVWPFRWLLSSAGMALNSFKPGAKQSMHGGQELQKGSGSSSYHRQAGSVKSCDHDYEGSLCSSIPHCSDREDGETRDWP